MTENTYRPDVYLTDEDRLYRIVKVETMGGFPTPKTIYTLENTSDYVSCDFDRAYSTKRFSQQEVVKMRIVIPIAEAA